MAETISKFQPTSFVAVKAVKYTGKRRNDYQQLVVLPRLRGEARNAVVNRLNALERKAKQQKAKRDLARELREAEEERLARIAEAKKEAEREAKRKEQQKKYNEKRKAERLAKKTIQAVAWDNLLDWVNARIGNKDLPFRLRLRSSVAKVSRIFNFSSYYHFQNWLEAIDKQGTIAESENYKKLAEVVGDEDVFNFVIPEFMAMAGGCNRHKEEHIVKETPYYTLNLLS